jgi:2-polyprenyl-3-methyl-5-hydroxy-6-metoxy-1,4-benzoquinol methylase
MKIGPEVFSYLKGEEFKNNLTFNIDRRDQEDISREAAIIRLIEGKKVIHVGCSDHIQIIREKIKNNIWLHKLITEKASKCIGIDIDEESIRFLKNELNYENVFHGNIISDDLPMITAEKWDYAVLGEMVEHLDNPVDFLGTLRKKYGPYISRFIITVPNIYNRSQLSNMISYREIINSDHRFWFTPYTISKVLVSAGYKPEEIIFCNRQKLNTFQLAIRKIKKMSGTKESYPYYFFRTMIIQASHLNS